MGIAFITAKAEKFQHQRDAAYEQELASPNLFSSRPEQVSQSYRFKALTEDVPAAGTRVLIYRSEGLIRAFDLNHPVGVAIEPDATELAGVMDQGNKAALAGQIVEVHPLAGNFVVAVSGANG